MCQTSDPAKRCAYHRGEGRVDDFDEAAVARLVSGSTGGAPARYADRVEAVRRLAAAGWSNGQIAHALGCYRRTVRRIRERWDIPATLTPGVGRGVPGVPNRPVGEG